MIRRRVRVWGRVQGVGYRLSAVSAARSRGLSGWVRNGSDGSVEAVFEGEPDAVEAMERWCERGPRGARVERVESFEEQPEGLDGFDVRDEPEALSPGWTAARRGFSPAAPSAVGPER